MKKFFQISEPEASKPGKIETFFGSSWRLSCQSLPLFEVFCLDFSVQAHLSPYTGVTSMILAPFFKLKANCLNMIRPLINSRQKAPTYYKNGIKGPQIDQIF